MQPFSLQVSKPSCGAVNIVLRIFARERRGKRYSQISPPKATCSPTGIYWYLNTKASLENLAIKPTRCCFWRHVFGAQVHNNIAHSPPFSQYLLHPHSPYINWPPTLPAPLNHGNSEIPARARARAHLSPRTQEVK